MLHLETASPSPVQAPKEQGPPKASMLAQAMSKSSALHEVLS